MLWTSESQAVGVDDMRAGEALDQFHGDSDSVGQHRLGECGRCRRTTLVGAAGFCADCHNERQWTRLNQAICNLIHRGGELPSRSF
jgi:hypothetical protein